MNEGHTQAGPHHDDEKKQGRGASQILLIMPWAGAGRGCGWSFSTNRGSREGREDVGMLLFVGIFCQSKGGASVGGCEASASLVGWYTEEGEVEGKSEFGIGMTHNKASERSGDKMLDAGCRCLREFIFAGGAGLPLPSI